MVGSRLRIGITGGIGSGKSLIGRLFELEGIPVYYADVEAKRLMVQNLAIRQGITNLFGTSSYENDLLNRAYLAKSIYAQPELNDALNALVHPIVEKHFEEWAEGSHLSNILAKEAALFFESGSYAKVDVMVNVAAPEYVRQERVLKRDASRSLEQVKAIMTRQLSEEEREARSHYTIHNFGDRAVLPQFQDTLHSIREGLWNEIPEEPG